MKINYQHVNSYHQAIAFNFFEYAEYQACEVKRYDCYHVAIIEEK